MGNRFIPDRRWWPQGLDPFLGTGSVVPKVLLCACPFLLPHLASLAANATCGCYTWFRVAAVRLQQVFIYRFAFGGCLCTSMCLALVPRFVILAFLVRVFVFFLCVPSIPLVLFRSKLLGTSQLSPALESMSHQCILLTLLRSFFCGLCHVAGAPSVAGQVRPFNLFEPFVPCCFYLFALFTTPLGISHCFGSTSRFGAYCCHDLFGPFS